MPKPVLTCTTPYGTLKRTTHRRYTHVVAVIFEGASVPITALSWCGTAQRAGAQLRYWAERYRKQHKPTSREWEIRAYPVDGSGAFPVGPIYLSPTVVDDGPSAFDQELAKYLPDSE